jgi:hypothetical protein
VNGAAICDFEQPRSLHLVERPNQFDSFLDATEIDPGSSQLAKSWT